MSGRNRKNTKPKDYSGLLVKAGQTLTECPIVWWKTGPEVRSDLFYYQFKLFNGRMVAGKDSRTFVYGSVSPDNLNFSSPG